MTFLKTRTDLVEYVKQIERQQDILTMSDLFTTIEKIAINTIYEKLLAYGEKKLRELALNINVNLN